MPAHRALLPVLLLTCLALPASAQDFVNFETPHVHPLERTPDGQTLLAVNTADGQLEVFAVDGGGVARLTAIPVGVDPVSVRARSDSEVWVVNHVSDSVSIVDLPTGRVRATLATADEPADVVFAGSPERAFVSCSQANRVLVFDPDDLGLPPVEVVIEGEDPRAMAVSADGNEVYVAVFESGNGSTVLGGGSTMGGGFPPNAVNDPAGPYGGQNPPPNDGNTFDPPIDDGLPPPPAVGLIVKQDAAGQWMDDNGGDWSDLVSGPDAALSGRPTGWELPDRDVAVIDADTLSVSYVRRLMNINMALSVVPGSGRLAVVGTDGTNEVRFEPVLTGTFVRVLVALVDVDGGNKSVVDLNPHLDYTVATLLQSERDRSLGDPRGIAWNAAGSRAYVTGMGSNNLVVIDATGARAGLSDTIEVGEGPTGLVVDDALDRLYVLNKFEASLSVVDTVSGTELDRLPFHDASPAAVKAGRKHLYDTHETSGLGQVACGSCHVDGRMDRLAWDLGNPGGSMLSVAGNNLGANVPGLNGSFEDFHPMKGPMLTQTLQDIIGKEPHHWRGDQPGLEGFNPAFIALQGDDEGLTAGEMQEYEDFLASIHFPPNPFRNLDNTLPGSLPLPGHYTTGRFGPAGQPLPAGNALQGLARYRPPNLLDAVACVTCHALPTGTGPDYTAVGFTLEPIPPGPNGERHHALVSLDGSTNVSMKVPQLRNLYERTGFNTTQASNGAGFGFLHDGSVDSIERFVSEPVFAVTSDQDVADMVAFMLAFSGSDLPEGNTNVLSLEPPGTAGRDAHAAVGRQTTLADLGSAPSAQTTLISTLVGLAESGAIGLIAKGPVAGTPRGWRYDGSGIWQADAAGETIGTGALQALAAPGGEITFTAVAQGSQTRLGIDRDRDGVLDADELAACSDPADPDSLPGSWTDLGSGLAGTEGLPLLTGCGSLAGGDPITLALSSARASSVTHLVIGVSTVDLPFKSGTLVPSPDILILGLPTGPGGELVLSGGMPEGLPAGVGLAFQHWIVDPAGPQGFAASNGLGGQTP